MAISYDVQLQSPVAGLLTPYVGYWVQLVSNNTGTAYVSTAKTDGTGKATFTPKPPGDTYVVNVSLVSNSGPWSAFGVSNWAVPVVQGENISMQSITGQSGSPYVVDPRIPVGGGIALPQTVNQSGRFDWNGGVGSTIYGAATSTGLVQGQLSAVIEVEAGTAAFLNDGPHDKNQGLLANNWTANGAGIVASNQGMGDGLYFQTIGTAGDGVSNGQTSWGLNGVSGSATQTTANGDLVHLKRYGAGSLLFLDASFATAGTGATRALADDINWLHGLTSRALLLNDTGTTIGDTLTVLSSGKTSGSIVQLFDSSAAFTGIGVKMNFGKTGGVFTGKYQSWQLNDVEKLNVDYTGTLNRSATSTDNFATNGIYNAAAGNNHFFQVAGANQAKIGANGVQVIAGAGFDCLTAGAINIGGSTASSVVMGKVGGQLGFYGHAVVSQPVAPVTLADVIAVIRGCGLSA